MHESAQRGSWLTEKRVPVEATWNITGHCHCHRIIRQKFERMKDTELKLAAAHRCGYLHAAIGSALRTRQRTWITYSSRDETVRFAYVIGLRTEGKQKHTLHKPKHNLRQPVTKYNLCSTYFLPATLPTPRIPLPFTFNGRGMHGLVPPSIFTNTFHSHNFFSKQHYPTELCATNVI